MTKGVLVTAMLPLLLATAPTYAATVTDPTGDFVPMYSGPTSADLDVTSFSVNYDPTTQLFTFDALLAGAIDASTPGFYVVGADTGLGAIHPFGAIGQPNVVFDKAIVIQKAGTGAIGSLVLDPATISINGNALDFTVPLSLLPSTGFSPEQYGFNLWPRVASGAQPVADFSPENSTLSVAAVPEPATWGMMILGFAAIGIALRYRKKSNTPAQA